MLKKTIPFLFLSALLLGACTDGNNDALPDNNETPMENIDDREKNWTPEMEDDKRGGTDLDGIETDEDMNDGGIMNNEEGDMNNRGNDPLLDQYDEDSENNNNR